MTDLTKLEYVGAFIVSLVIGQIVQNLLEINPDIESVIYWVHNIIIYMTVWGSITWLMVNFKK